MDQKPWCSSWIALLISGASLLHNATETKYYLGSDPISSNPDWLVQTKARRFYYAFHKQANSKVQKQPSQLRFSLPIVYNMGTSGQFLQLVYIATFCYLAYIATFPHLTFFRNFGVSLGFSWNLNRFEPVLGHALFQIITHD